MALSSSPKKRVESRQKPVLFTLYCVFVCPVGAIIKTAEGVIVLVNTSRSMIAIKVSLRHSS